MDTLNGFEIFDDLMPGAMANKNKQTDQNITFGAGEELTDEELEQIRNQGKQTSKTDDTKNKDDDNDVNPNDDDTDDKTKSTVTKKNVSDSKNTVKKTDTQDTDDNDDTQADDNDTDDTDNNNPVSAFFGVLADKMGWDIDEEDEVPSTPEELVNYFQQVIEDNSVPQYASEEVEKLDAFVKNGGDIKKYFEIDAPLDIEDIDITEEDNQKSVVREFLREKGFNTKQIDKKLTKYEDAGLLEDEAEDALEALKEIREQKKQQLLENQEKAAVERQKQQQAYFNAVVNEIKGMDNIRGVKIPEKDKRVLLEYIFKPNADGVTGFQRDWQKSVKNLIESAYFTMKGDTLVQAAKAEGSTAAINRFKNSLNTNSISKKTKKQDNTSTESMWDSFARQFRVN